METLPTPVQRYLAAENDHDPAAMAACFTANGKVADDGEIISGRDAIRAWARRVIDELRPTSSVTSVERSGPEVVVGVSISGTFEGSPADLRLTFVIEKDRIASYRAEVSA